MLDFLYFGLYGYIGILFISLIINLIPFASPSNFVISGVIMLLFPKLIPFYVALSVALGATVSKSSHYYLSHYIVKKTAKIDTERINKFRSLINRWGAFGAFLAAVSPIPDDPVVIPLGVLRFNFLQFVTSYFAGKVLLCFIGAFSASRIVMAIDLFDIKLVLISIVLSIIVLSIILKLNPDKLHNISMKVLKKLLKIK